MRCIAFEGMVMGMVVMIVNLHGWRQGGRRVSLGSSGN